MLDWLGDAVNGLASGMKSLLSWLFSGVLSILSKVVSACSGIFDVLDSLWDFFVGVKDALVDLMVAFFPWIPPEVMLVFSLGLLAVLLAGIVKKVRGK